MSEPNHNQENPQESSALKRFSTLETRDDELKKPGRGQGRDRKRVLLLGLCAIVLLAGVVWGITALTKTVAEQMHIKAMLLTDREVGEVAGLTIEMRDGLKLSITQEDGVYSVDKISPQMLSQAECHAAYINISRLMAEDIAAEGVSDFAPYGLERPVSVVHARFTDGEELTLEIGDRVPVNPYYYARVNGTDAVYQIKGLLVGIYADGENSFRDLSGLSVNTDRAIAFSLEREGKETIEMDFQAKVSGFRFTQWQMKQPFLADVVTVPAEELMGAVNELSLTRYVDTTADGSPYGLDDPSAVFRFVNDDGSTFSLYIGDRITAGNAYIRFDDAEDIYLAAGASLKWLDDANVSALLSEFSNIQAIGNVNALTVEMDGVVKNFAIDRSGGEPVYTKDGMPVDADAFKAAFQASSTAYVDNVINNAAALENAAVDLRLTYTFAGGEIGVVEYVDAGVYHYGVRKNGTLGIAIRKADVQEMLEAWRAM